MSSKGDSQLADRDIHGVIAWQRLVRVLPIFVLASAVTLVTTQRVPTLSWVLVGCAAGAAAWTLQRRARLVASGLSEVRLGWTACCLLASAAILPTAMSGREWLIPFAIATQALVPLFYGR